MTRSPYVVTFVVKGPAGVQPVPALTYDINTAVRMADHYVAALPDSIAFVRDADGNVLHVTAGEQIRLKGKP